jgi:hypothetical protein
MAKNLTQSYIKGVGLIETAYKTHGAEADFDRAVNQMLHAAEASRAPHDTAHAEGAAHALSHLKAEGLVRSNPRETTPKMIEAQRRSRAVLARAHAILAANNCSFKGAMGQAWTELREGKIQPMDPRPKVKKPRPPKVKTNSGGIGTRGMDHLWRQAMDGNEWAHYLEARAGKAYNVPDMYANGRGSRGGRRTRANNGDLPTRGMDALWLQAWDGQPWAQHEMARTGRAYNVPNMWAGQNGGNEELILNATKQNPGLRKGQNIMKLAAQRYRAGEFSSMQDAVSAVAAERRGR